mgnify:CR=1 FL=1
MPLGIHKAVLYLHEFCSFKFILDFFGGRDCEPQNHNDNDTAEYKSVEQFV